jgi:hypothetical protein
MRSDLGGLDQLTRTVDNLIMARQEEQIEFPLLVPIGDMLWKFNDSGDPKPFANCTKEELLKVVESLIGHVRNLDDRLKIQEFSKQALCQLL